MNMNCRINVFLLNEHFSIEHAEAHHGGEESENNQKYEWEDEMEIAKGVVGVNMLGNGVYPLQGSYDNGEAFSIEVPITAISAPGDNTLPALYTPPIALFQMISASL